MLISIAVFQGFATLERLSPKLQIVGQFFQPGMAHLGFGFLRECSSQPPNMEGFCNLLLNDIALLLIFCASGWFVSIGREHWPWFVNIEHSGKILFFCFGISDLVF